MLYSDNRVIIPRDSRTFKLPVRDVILSLTLSDGQQLEYSTKVATSGLLEAYHNSSSSGEKFGATKRFSYKGLDYVGLDRPSGELKFPEDIGLVRVAESVKKKLLFVFNLEENRGSTLEFRRP